MYFFNVHIQRSFLENRAQEEEKKNGLSISHFHAYRHLVLNIQLKVKNRAVYLVVNDHGYSWFGTT